jgi:hypothetical protein
MLKVNVTVKSVFNVTDRIAILDYYFSMFLGTCLHNTINLSVVLLSQLNNLINDIEKMKDMYIPSSDVDFNVKRYSDCW